jgi:hypothetical protein
VAAPQRHLIINDLNRIAVLFALNNNENLTGAVAGTSPSMLHKNYRGLATRAEAEKWFAVFPPDAAKNVIQLGKTVAK